MKQQCSPERLALIDEGIAGWQKFVNSEKRGLKLGVRLVPSVAHNLIDAAHRTIEALRIEKRTGVAVCSCCHKPYGEGIRL